MDETEAQSVLRRMTAAGRQAEPPSRAVVPARALAAGVSRAAEAAMSLAVHATSASERTGGLPDLLETVPESGLLAVLEGPREAQGLVSFDSALLTAVIEKQMTGALAARAPSVRAVTRTDAVLAADLIDAALREFEAPFRGRAEAKWAAGFGYSSHVEDIRPLGLLLEDVDYRIFVLELDLDQGSRTGRAVLALPAEGRGEVGVAEDVPLPEAPRDDAWRNGFGSAVRGADVRLEAVLHRVRLPFGQVRKLQVGDEIALPPVSIDRVRVVATGGGTFAVGRLGQSRGNRAVRLAAFGDQVPKREQASATVVTLPDLQEAGGSTAAAGRGRTGQGGGRGGGAGPSPGAPPAPFAADPMPEPFSIGALPELPPLAAD